MHSINIPQVLSCIFKEKFKVLSSSLKHTTYPGKDSSPFFFIWSNMFSIFDLLWSQSLFKKEDNSYFKPHPIFFFFFYFSLCLFHTHPKNMPRLYALIPVGPPAVLLGGLTQPIVCRQPVGISLTAWQTVILDTTHTPRKGQVQQMRCDLLPNNNQKNLLRNVAGKAWVALGSAVLTVLNRGDNSVLLCRFLIVWK